MQKYEYKAISNISKKAWGGSINMSEFTQELNDLAHDGWELVNSFSTNERIIVSVFKREIIKNNE